MSALDFSQIKASISLQQAATMLGLTLKHDKEKDQYRGECPRCQRGGPRALVITPARGWTCFAQKVDNRYPGGDCIALVAHCRGVTFKEAAQQLATSFPVSGPRPVAEAVQRLPVPDKLATVQDYLVYEHPLVQGLGLTPEAAAKLKVGYKPKGVLTGYVVAPLYNDGQLVSYMGFHPEKGVLFPPKISERI